jgi:hypothetical protein
MEKKVCAISKNDDIKNYNKYMDSLVRIVEQHKQKFPEKYKRAQDVGEFVMSSNYNVEIGKDKEGTDKRVELILKTMNDYQLTIDDLREDEIKLLKENEKI